MGMVFQNYAVWPHKTVFENVVFGLKLRKLPSAAARQKVDDMLALVNLAGLEGRYPGELSGGQQQRVALARSLVVEPDILLLDEPLSNLDAKLRERMRVELKELQRRTGITFVYVTHDQAEALALSDQVAVMQRRALAAIRHAVRGLRPSGQPHGGRFHGPGEPGAGPHARDEERRRQRRARRPISRSGSPSIDGLAVGERVDVAIRPENIRLAPTPPATATGGTSAKVTSHVFLGNLSEYEVTLPSGPVLRVQTHPLQQFKVGDPVAIEIDATQCSVFPRIRGERTAA